MLIREAKFSLWCFLATTSILALILIDSVFGTKSATPTYALWWWLPCYYTGILCYLRVKYSRYLFQVGIRSVFLGGVFAFGVFIIFYSPVEWKLFGIYACVMSFFHYSEFLAIAWCNPKTLSLSSFLLNHSTQYNAAAMASWLEFVIEVYLIPDLKLFHSISCIGFLLCVVGEIFRKSAMITGSTNFAHIVQTEKSENHQLVTHGIYSICRHPSYVGWFYWSIGTQLLLLNPICVVGYAIVSWRFFAERIFHEEHTLLYFFGEEYILYQKSVKTGLPGIKGFLLEEE